MIDYKKLWRAVSPLVMLGAVFLVMFIFSIPCPIKWLTGVSCPGCGMSRAMFSALRLDFASAFYFHPLWCFLLPWFAVYAVVSTRKMKKTTYACLGVAIAALFGVWLVRIINPNEVVVFSPENGAIARLIQYIIGLFS